MTLEKVTHFWTENQWCNDRISPIKITVVVVALLAIATFVCLFLSAKKSITIALGVSSGIILVAGVILPALLKQFYNRKEVENVVDPIVELTRNAPSSLRQVLDELPTLDVPPNACYIFPQIERDLDLLNRRSESEALDSEGNTFFHKLASLNRSYQDPNKPFLGNSHDSDLSCQFGDKTLIGNPLRFMQTNKKGETPLDLAIRFNQFHYTKMIFTYIHLSSYFNTQGETVCHAIIRSSFTEEQKIELIRTFFENEYNIQPNRDHVTPQQLALQMNQNGVANVLNECLQKRKNGVVVWPTIFGEFPLFHKETMHGRNEQGETLLTAVLKSSAEEKNKLRWVSAILQWGPLLDINNLGESPIELAEKLNLSEIVLLLKNYNAKMMPLWIKIWASGMAGARCLYREKRGLPLRQEDMDKRIYKGIE